MMNQNMNPISPAYILIVQVLCMHGCHSYICLSLHEDGSCRCPSYHYYLGGLDKDKFPFLSLFHTLIIYHQQNYLLIRTTHILSHQLRFA